jgi:endoglucanase Acf2
MENKFDKYKVINKVNKLLGFISFNCDSINSTLIDIEKMELMIERTIDEIKYPDVVTENSLCLDEMESNYIIDDLVMLLSTIKSLESQIKQTLIYFVRAKDYIYKLYEKWQMYPPIDYEEETEEE